MKLRYLLFACLLLSSSKLKAQSTTSWLDALCDSVRQATQVPALSCAVIKTDGIEYGISGFTANTSMEKVRLDQPFHIGSNSKAITSYIAFRMIEEEKISLDTRFFDLVSDIDKRRWRYRKITLGDLLSHTSRLPSYTQGDEFQTIPDWINELSVSGQRLGFAGLVVRQKPLKKGRNYSNAGYVLASLMLERASSVSFEELVEKYLGELGIEYFYGFPVKKNPAYPMGHWFENGRLEAHDSGHAYGLQDYMRSAGDFSMTLPHYSKFVQENLKGLHQMPVSLSNQNVLQMHYGKSGYAYGWGNQISDVDSLSFHDGSAGTFYTHTIISAKREIAIVIFCNSGQINQAHHLLRSAILKSLNSKARK